MQMSQEMIDYVDIYNEQLISQCKECVEHAPCKEHFNRNLACDICEIDYMITRCSECGHRRPCKACNYYCSSCEDDICSICLPQHQCKINCIS